MQDSELAAEAERYLQAGMAGRRTEAVAVVREVLDRGVSPQRVAAHLLVPAQVEVGRRWEAGEVSVAEEHQVTDLTHTCLSILGALRPARPLEPDSPRLVAATVGDEGHGLGLRLLADTMEQAGWWVEYLGSGVPDDVLVAHVARVRPLVLALSATVGEHVGAAGDLVGRLRRDPATAAVRVLVGGRAVQGRPDLLETIGADGWAATPEEAVAVCAAWLPAPPPVPRGEARDLGSDHDLSSRYRFAERHMAGALALLAEQSGLSVVELRARLGRLPG